MILDFQNVFKSYFQGDVEIPVLQGVNLKLEKGQTASIVGESGSGKTTLLSMMAGLDKPSSGRAIVLGQDVQEMDDEAMASLRAQKMGIVFQNYYLIPHLTAIENVLLPLQLSKSRNLNNTQQKELAMSLLKQVKLESRAHHFSHQLSGGEAQRVALARALIHNPQLVLADEPSGNLDEETGVEVMDLLFNLVESQDQTLVLVTHNKVLAQRCRRNFMLKAGRLQEV